MAAVQVSATAFTTAVILCFSLAIMHRSVGLFNLRAVTIPALWYWTYLAIVLIPGFFVASAHPEPYRTRYLIGIESAIITVPLGVWFANLILRFRKEEIVAYFRRRMVRNPEAPQFTAAFLGLLGLAVAFSVAYAVQAQTIPLYDMITHPGADEMLVQAREESLKLMDSHFVYAYAVLRSTLYPLLILIALGKYLTTRRSPWGVLLVLTLAVGLVYSALTIAKSPVTALVLVAAFFYYLYRGGRVRPRAIVSVLALTLAFPIFVVLSEQAGYVGFVSALQGIGDRMFHLPAEILYYYFRVFPDVVPHQHGGTIGKLAWLMGVKPFDDANFVGRYMFAHAVSSITANAPFLGSLYTDFAMPGVFAGAFLAGFIMQTLQIYILRQPKTYLNLALFSFLLFAFGMLNGTTLPVVLLSDGALLAVGFIWVMQQIDSRAARPIAVRSVIRGASVGA